MMALKGNCSVHGNFAIADIYDPELIANEPKCPECRKEWRKRYADSILGHAEIIKKEKENKPIMIESAQPPHELCEVEKIIRQWDNFIEAVKDGTVVINSGLFFDVDKIIQFCRRRGIV